MSTDLKTTRPSDHARALALADDPSIPAHLREGAMRGDQNDDGLDGFVRPSRIKIVQPLSKAPLTDMFKAGDAILTPMNHLLAGRSESFLFVPLYFWPEWLTINPLGSDIMIADRSLDVRSDIAAKARDEKKRKELVPGTKDKYLTHKETMNYLLQVVSVPELYDTQVVVSFSGAEHKTGSNLAGLLKMRRPIKMYGTVWKATSALRTNDKGQWWGLDIVQPVTEQGPALVLDPGEYARYEAMNAAMRDLLGGGKIIIDHEQDLKDADTSAEPKTEF